MRGETYLGGAGVGFIEGVTWKTSVVFLSHDIDIEDVPEESLRFLSNVVEAGDLYKLADSLRIHEEFEKEAPQYAVDAIASIGRMIDVDPLFDGIIGHEPQVGD